MKLSFYNPKTQDSLIIYNFKQDELFIGKKGGKDDGEGMHIDRQEFIDMLYSWYREKF